MSTPEMLRMIFACLFGSLLAAVMGYAVQSGSAASKILRKFTWVTIPALIFATGPFMVLDVEVPYTISTFYLVAGATIRMLGATERISSDKEIRFAYSLYYLYAIHEGLMVPGLLFLWDRVVLLD